jgi:hypothetical protein
MILQNSRLIERRKNLLQCRNNSTHFSLSLSLTQLALSFLSNATTNHNCNKNVFTIYLSSQFHFIRILNKTTAAATTTTTTITTTINAFWKKEKVFFKVCYGAVAAAAAPRDFFITIFLCKANKNDKLLISYHC